MGQSCSKCAKELPTGARYCPWCGAAVTGGSPASRQQAATRFAAPQAIAERFFDMLYDTLEEQQDPARFDAYMARLQGPDFQPVFEARMQQLSDQVQHLLQRAIEPEAAIERLLQRALDELLDLFLVRYAAELNVHPLPGGILKYGYADLRRADLYCMIMDYLDWPSLPEELVYTNLLEVAEKLLRNAAKHFLFVERNERVFFLHDWTLLHTLKAGFAMTDVAIYWRLPGSEPHKIYYHHLRHATVRGRRLEINGKYFYAHPTLHVRLVRLLRKIMARQHMIENE